MMMVIIIGIKDLMIILRDKRALITILLMPLILIIILGNALGFMFEDDFNVDRFNIAVVNEDNGVISDFFIDGVLLEAGNDYFDTLEVTGGEAEEMMSKGNVEAVIYIPENMTADIENQINVSLIIKAADFDIIEMRIVTGVVESFTRRLSTGFAGTRATLESYNEYIKDIEGSEQVMDEPAADDVMLDMIIEMGSRSINYKDLEYGDLSNINGVQYYTATILIMFILFGASFGARLFIDERESKTLSRVMTTMASKATIVFGKFIGLFLITFVQSIILILFSSLVFGVNWGPSFLGVVIVALSSIFAGSSIGMFLAAVTKTQRGVSALSQIFIHVFNILGGGMVPLRLLPDFFQNLGKISINWWSVEAFHDLMMGYSIEKILPYCLVLLCMGIVYLTIGITRLKID